MKLICEKCKGNKSVRGMGCVIEICKECKGKGFKEFDNVVSKKSPIVNIVKPLKGKKGKQHDKEKKED